MSLLSETTDNPLAWQRDAACAGVDPELFYPSAKFEGSRTHYSEPLRICAGCPVKAECLDWAYELNDQWAVLGGLSPRQRAKTRAAWNKRKAVSA